MAGRAGLLWFNAHRRRCSWATWGAGLGGALGTIAVIVRQKSCWPSGGIFLSSGAVGDAAGHLVQIHHKRRYGEGRRLLKIPPLHHHFEKSGWKNAGGGALWIITMLLCLVGLTTQLR